MSAHHAEQREAHSVDDESDLAGIITAHLRVNAERYVVDHRPVTDVVLERVHPRPGALLFWFRVVRPDDTLKVVVKVPGTGGPTSPGHSGRPSLVEPMPPGRRYAREYDVLRMLESHIAALNDTRFGAVSAVDRIDSVGALVMMAAEGRSLKSLVPKATALGRREPWSLRAPVRNAGAWLRRYHEIEVPGLLTRHASRDAFVEAIGQYCDFLSGSGGRQSTILEIERGSIAAARRLFPDELPTGPAHGDFAARNILVASDSRVYVFDTRALSRAPVLEDLAKFGLAFRTARAQVYTRGFAMAEPGIRQLERWLYEGYFDRQPAPSQQIRLYSVLLLLDKWAFELAGTARMGRARRTVVQRLVTHWFQRLAASTLAELH